MVGVGGVGNGREYAHYGYHDHELDQRETPSFHVSCPFVARLVAGFVFSRIIALRHLLPRA